MSGVWEYFTPVQQEKLKKKIEQVREQIGPEELKRLGKESNELISKLHVGLETGIPPDDPEVVLLAKHLAESQAMFDVGDPKI